MKKRFYVFKFTGQDIYLREYRTPLYKVGHWEKRFTVTDNPTDAKQFDLDDFPSWLDYFDGTVVVMNVEVENGSKS